MRAAIATAFTGFEDYWQPFLGAQGPAPAYVAALPEERRTRLRDAPRARLPVGGDGALVLRGRAWAVRGTTEQGGRADQRTHGAWRALVPQVTKRGAGS